MHELAITESVVAGFGDYLGDAIVTRTSKGGPLWGQAERGATYVIKKMLFTAVVLGTAFFVVKGIPDVARYLKIRNM